MGIFLKDINLKGKTALITGATKGLGRGAAIAIAEAGGNVIAIGRNQKELNTLRKEIKKFKVNYVPFSCDVNDFNRLKSFWGMNCYIINKEGARKFIDEVRKTQIDGQVDCYLSRMIQQKKINIYSTKTHLVSSNSNDTNIQTLLKPIKNVDPYDYKGYRV